MLVERTHELALLDDALSSLRGTRRGRLVLLAGEAGAGKTSVVRAFVAGLTDVRVLAGACEALHTARPLGPLVDIAAQAGGELEELVERSAHARDVLAALGRELERHAPTVVLLEDLHSADEPTLDLLRLLARRVSAMPALFVATYRDDGLERTHPLRIALGQLWSGGVTRMSLAPLTAHAVAELAAPFGVDPVPLYERTLGNPFYVAEALAAGGATVPDTVRDAVLARASRLGGGARRLLDAVAVMPPHAELRRLEDVAGGDLEHLEECLTSGLLRAHDGGVSFRHEIARVAVAEALPPDVALSLHRATLTSLVTTGEQIDAARLAHHAEAAGDRAAVLWYARAAGERAAAAGAHAEAAAQFARALRFADGLPGDERASLLEQHSYECYLTSATAAAAEARREALAEHRARCDARAEGDALRWLSRLAWEAGDRDAAVDDGWAAVQLLETRAPGVELAFAYGNASQLAMLAGDLEGARQWGSRASELGERLGETSIVAQVLNTIGSAEVLNCIPEGFAKLRRSLELASEAGLDHEVARAYTNLAATAMRLRDHDVARRYIDQGIAYCVQHDLNAYRLPLLGSKARLALDEGRWSDAVATAAEVLTDTPAGGPARIVPLVVLGLARARTGDGDPWDSLDEARGIAEAMGEPPTVALVAAARAEAHWLEGDDDLIGAATEGAVALAAAARLHCVETELRVWRRRAGIVEAAPALGALAPFQLELDGKAAAAAKSWRRLGCPYEAALAATASADESVRRRSLAELQRLGARAAAGRVGRLLREQGVRDLTRGPRAATRKNPAGLTVRELEVLELVAAGHRNVHIAERLVVSAKTVDHHVSAILRKLKVGTRTEAAVQALRLGLLGD